MATTPTPNQPTDKPAAPAPAAAPELVDEVDRDTMGEPREFERVEPTKNPRDQVMARLAAAAREEEGQDQRWALDESGDRPVMRDTSGEPGAAAPAPAGGELAPALLEPATDTPPGEQQRPPDAGSAPPAPGAGGEPPPRMRINVLGREVEVSVDDIYNAGVATLQKQSAADVRLQQASALLDDAQRIRDAAQGGRAAPAQPHGPAATGQDSGELQAALEARDHAAAAAVVARMMDRGVNAQSIEDLVSQRVATQVREVLQHEAAVAQLHQAIPNLPKDPVLQSMAATVERSLRMADAQAGVRRSYAAIYQDVANHLASIPSRLGFASAAPTPTPTPAGNGGNLQGTLQQRQAAKVATPQPVVPAGGRPAAPASNRPPTGSAIIAQMKSRRNGQMRI